MTASTPIDTKVDAGGLLKTRAELLRFSESLRDEWLATDGRGGYASSTTLGCPTRRYHGLFVTHLGSGTERYVLLQRFDDRLRVEPSNGDEAVEFDLSIARYEGAWAPQGHLNVEHFWLGSHPCTRFRCGAVVIERELILARGPRAVLVRYTLLEAPGPCRVFARPFLPYRDTHSLTVENEDLDTSIEVTETSVRCRPYPSLPALHFTVDRELRFESAPHWYNDFEYLRDQERGFPCHEDVWSPGEFELLLEPGASVVLAAGLEPITDPEQVWKDESRSETLSRPQLGAKKRRNQTETQLDRIRASAEDFIYRRPGGGEGIIAGFPWFGEWGRDTFISLPGLTISRGELRRCGAILEGSVQFLRNGLLPNIFGTGRSDSDYDSADAALWFARAVALYARAGGDTDLCVQTLLPAIVEIAEHYEAGTALGIGADDAGLLHAGAKGLNATWMDAQTPDGPVTPRDGCAVELNALWYSLLQQIEEHYDALGDRTTLKRWQKSRRRAKRSFMERFWLADEKYLADRFHDGEPDRKVRPNMVIAAALENSPLTRDQRRSVVERARVDLLTSRGLRTLAPDDPEYVGRYAGGPLERDSAYHQGTVWPWLLGFYVEARLRAFGNTTRERAQLASLWSGLEEDLDRFGLNHFSEVYDGDAPQHPGGTIAQAWNTAEYLRARAMLGQD